MNPRTPGKLRGLPAARGRRGEAADAAGAGAPGGPGRARHEIAPPGAAGPQGVLPPGGGGGPFDRPVGRGLVGGPRPVRPGSDRQGTDGSGPGSHFGRVGCVEDSDMVTLAALNGPNPQELQNLFMGTGVLAAGFIVWSA